MVDVTTDGTVTVDPNEEYVIKPSVDGDVKFQAASGASTPVPFTITIEDDLPESFSIKMDGDAGDLSPTINIDPNIDASEVDFDLKNAADATIDAGDNVSIGSIVGADGADDITFGDDASILGGIDTGNGSDNVVLGNDADFGSKSIDLGGSKAPEMNTLTAGDGLNAKDVLGGKGEDDITIGDGASVEKIDTGEGNDTIEIGDNYTGKEGLAPSEIKTGDGEDSLTIGDGATVKKIDTGDGADTLEIGDGLGGINGSKPPEILTGKGDDDVTIGDDAFFKKLDTGSGADVANVGTLNIPDDGTTTLDGGGGSGDFDCLVLDISWLSASEEQQFFDTLAENDYVFDASEGGYVAGDGDGDGKVDQKQTFTIDLDNGGKLKFKGWEKISAVCFASGTKILTPRGEIAIEDLKAGDVVLTMDRGFQAIRWIGSTKVPAKGHLAPVRIKAGAYGNVRDLCVSPQHRILLKGSQLEMMFGESEALVAAKHLVDGENVVIEEGGEVHYFHMLFSEHEIVYAEGMPSESFHPGAVGLDSMEEAVRREIYELFPQLEADVAAYGASCRISLKGHEAKIAMEQKEMAAQ